MTPEPLIGATITEKTGHSWTRNERGGWDCSCGDEQNWEWADVLDDIQTTPWTVDP